MSIMPIGISFTDWAANLRNEYPALEFPIITDENLWKEWAQSLILEPSFNNVALPDSRLFGSWQEWAIRFTEIIGA